MQKLFNVTKKQHNPIGHPIPVIQVVNLTNSDFRVDPKNFPNPTRVYP